MRFFLIQFSETPNFGVPFLWNNKKKKERERRERKKEKKKKGVVYLPENEFRDEKHLTREHSFPEKEKDHPQKKQSRKKEQHNRDNRPNVSSFDFSSLSLLFSF